MTQLDFEEISGRNFQSFEAFTLPIRPGKHLILGEVVGSTTESSNGAGKSSLFEALVYACTKQTYREKNCSKDQKGNCLTSVKLRKGSDPFRIDRYLGDSNFANKVKIFQNDEDLTARKGFSTEEELKKILMVSPEILTTTIVVLQGLPINFTQLGPTVRKAMVEDYLGFSVWNNFRPRFSSHLKNLAMSRAAMADELMRSQRQMNDHQQKLHVQQAVEGDQQERFQKEISDLKEGIQQQEVEISRLQTQRAGLTSFFTAQLTQHVNDLMQSIALLKNKAKALTMTIRNKVCTQCEQNYPVERIQLASQELEHIYKKLDTLGHLLIQQNELLEKVKQVDKQIYDQEYSRNQKFQYLKILVDKAQSQPKQDLGQLEEQLQLITHKVDQLTDNLLKMDQSMDHVKYLDSLLLPSSVFRTKVLENYLSYINTLMASVAPLIFDQLDVKLIIEEKNNGIDFEISKKGIQKSYQSLSGGEKRKLDLICILSFQKFLIESSGVSSNLLVFDEIFDHIDSKGIDNILAGLDVLFPETSCLYIISHNNNLKSRFSSVINVIKENDCSTLDLSKYALGSSM